MICLVKEIDIQLKQPNGTPAICAKSIIRLFCSIAGTLSSKYNLFYHVTKGNYQTDPYLNK